MGEKCDKLNCIFPHFSVKNDILKKKSKKTQKKINNLRIFKYKNNIKSRKY